MIKASCDKGMISISANGSTVELCADMMTILCSIYNSLFEQNTLNAIMFRDYIESHISNAFELLEDESDEEAN